MQKATTDASTQTQPIVSNQQAGAAPATGAQDLGAGTLGRALAPHYNYRRLRLPGAPPVVLIKGRDGDQDPVRDGGNNWGGGKEGREHGGRN